MNILKRLSKEWLFFDGGTGSILQERGLKPGELPETWNLLHPEEILSLHLAYLNAGCNVFNTNTFGANRLKYPDNLKDIVKAAVKIAKKAREDAGREGDAYIALDIGPTGKLLKPMGDLSFEDAVLIFSEVIAIGEAEGVDLILIETMNDSYEMKAAVLAAKESSSLPVFTTMVFDEKGKMLTGGTPESMTAMLEGLSVDALGINCSLGPKQMIPIVERLVKCSSTPIIVNPNAGLPRVENGCTVYDVDAENFSDLMLEIVSLGVQGIGGCCGTTPLHIRKTIEKVAPLPVSKPVAKKRTVVSSFSQCVLFGERRPVLVGERINPTGKKRFKEALRNKDIDYILTQGIEQEDAGADILDVNVGLPEIDECAMLTDVVFRLQGITGLPLQIDTSDPVAMEQAVRIYNGKAMLNSVNGKQESMDSIFPIAKKYGAVLVALPLDEKGIPETAGGRIAIAEKIINEAKKYGIKREDIIIDGLCMTVSADAGSGNTTLETVRRIGDELHLKSILGVSNVSFGLPARDVLNSVFFTMAIEEGLSAAIINPNNAQMMQSYRAFIALSGQDENFTSYINASSTYQVTSANKPIGQECNGQKYNGQSIVKSSNVDSGIADSGISETNGQSRISSNGSKSSISSNKGSHASDMSLKEAVRRGMAEKAKLACKEALKSRKPLDIVNEDLVPALDIVGKGFEQGTIFLPQLLMAAEAVKAAFEIVKQSMKGEEQAIKGRVILATVKGDIHDIGKNIVKVMLENYGYEVLDLGKDVPPETIVDTAIKEDIKVAGLSALMTTTVGNMADTIKLFREKKPDTKIVVGGAVMTKEYAEKIGADRYAKNAMATVRYCDEVFGTCAE